MLVIFGSAALNVYQAQYHAENIALELMAEDPPHSDKGAAAGKKMVFQPAQVSGACASGAARLLDRAQRQQLLVALVSDFPHALESITALLGKYRGTDYQQELELLSEKLSAFDSDAVVMLVGAMLEKLRQQK